MTQGGPLLSEPPRPAMIEAMKQIGLGLNRSTKKTRKRDFLNRAPRIRRLTGTVPDSDDAANSRHAAVVRRLRCRIQLVWSRAGAGYFSVLAAAERAFGSRAVTATLGAADAFAARRVCGCASKICISHSTNTRTRALRCRLGA